jgi:signal peptidase I
MDEKKKINWNMHWNKDSKKGDKKRSAVRETIEAIVVAFVLALLIRTFVVQAFKIPSGSMLPTLQIGDHILVNKFIYWFTDPKRKDIIVFKYPRDKKRDFIKRLVGLPGETVEIKDQKLYINGKLMDEPYAYHSRHVPPTEQIYPRDNFGPIKVPLDSVFVMGDNRESSQDSRYWGTLKKDLIKGEAFVIYWSIKPYQTYGRKTFFLKRWYNYLASFKDRIRWERLGMVLR